MAQVVFYEKPGCINNRKQKQLLSRAGHQIDARNLLTEDWSVDTLRPYLDQQGPEFWVNRSHPDLKAKRLCLPMTDAEQLLQMLCDDPLLIRRPLLAVDGRYFQGFDAEQLHQLIDLSGVTDNLEDCPRSHQTACSTAY